MWLINGEAIQPIALETSLVVIAESASDITDDRCDVHVTVRKRGSTMEIDETLPEVAMERLTGNSIELEEGVQICLAGVDKVYTVNTVR